MRRNLLPLLLLLALIGSACQVKIEQTTRIEDDGSGQIVLDVLLDEELRTLSGFEDAASAFELAGGVPEGFTVEDLVVDDFAGARAMRDFADIDELNTVLQDAATAGLADQVTVVREGNEYRYSATIGDLSAAAEGLGGFITVDTFDDFFDIVLAVRMPGDVVDNNADAVREDGTLVWEIGIDDSGKTISATSRVATDWAPVAIGVILLLVLLGGGVMLVRNRMLKSSSDAPPADGPFESPTI